MSLGADLQIRLFFFYRWVALRHVARPAVSQVPVLVVDECKIQKGKVFLQQSCQGVKDRFCPMANKYNKLINVPCNPSSEDLVSSPLNFV